MTKPTCFLSLFLLPVCGCLVSPERVHDLLEGTQPSPTDAPPSSEPDVEDPAGTPDTEPAPDEAPPPVDLDGDGFDAALDCNDLRPDAWPGAPEVAYDGFDQDCDGADLDDLDGDGFAGGQGDDCDDADAAIHPEAPEVCRDGIDQDCRFSHDVCGIGGLVTADRAHLTLASSRAGAWLGKSLAGGQDGTLDGLPDLIVGAPYGAAVHPDAGEVYVVEIAKQPAGLVEVERAWRTHLVGEAGSRLGHRIVAGPRSTLGALAFPTSAWAADGEHGASFLAHTPFTPGGYAVEEVVARVTSTVPTIVQGGPAAIFRSPLGTVALTTQLDVDEGRWMIYQRAFFSNRGAVWPANQFLDTDGNLVGSTVVWSDATVLDVAAGHDVIDGDAPGVEDWAVATRDVDDRTRVHVAHQVLTFGYELGRNLPVTTWEVPFAADDVVVRLVPDLTGDDRGDLVIGATCEGACGGGGTVWVVPGGMPAGTFQLSEVGRLLHGLVFEGSASGSQHGASVAWAGDVNGDGFGDLLVGAPGEEDGRGAAYLVPGPVEGSLDAFDVGTALHGARLVGESAVDLFGTALGHAGDVDGDGFDDIAVGAPLAPKLDGTGSAGRVYVFRGGAD